MAIKNYTTKISADKSVAEIQAILSRHGVRAILLQYADNGSVSAVSFRAITPRGERAFCLPARVDRMEELLKKQGVKHDRETAERVTWRNIKDWVDAQMALIEVELINIDEAFFAYMIDGSGKSLYESLTERGRVLEDGQR